VVAQSRAGGGTHRFVLAGPGRLQTPATGALPILHAAVAAGLPGGVCVGPDGFLQRTGHPAVVRTSRRSRDRDLAAALWDRSEELTGVRYSCIARAF
jgi:hypothetical protein